MAVVLLSAAALQFWMPSIRLNPDSAPASARPPADTAPMHVDIAFPEDAPLAFVGPAALGNGRTAFALSPDGQSLVYLAKYSNGHALYLRDFRTREVRRLAGTDEGYDPFFSPNGRWIAFFSGNLLKRVSIDGGEAVTMTEATNSAGGTWLGNDSILALTHEGDHLLRYNFDGTREEFEAPVSGTAPHALPDQKTVIWSAFGEDMALYDHEKKELNRLPLQGSAPYYSNGLLFFTRGSTLYASLFDPDSLSLDSNPVPVLTGLRIEVYSFAHWSLAANGTFLYAPGGLASENPLAWVSSDGPEDLELPRRIKGTFEISPDGEYLAVLEHRTEGRDIRVYGFEDSSSRKITVETDPVNPMVWEPGGNDLIYHRGIPGRREAFVLSLNSGRPGTPVLDARGGSLSVDSVSADGRYLGISRSFPEGETGGQASQASRMAVYDRVENREVEIPDNSDGNWGVTVSPDGRWVVYTSPASGEYQIYLQPVPPTGERFQVSRTGGAEEPRWSPDGKLIYYRSGQRIMVVDVQGEPKLLLGEPRVFYEGNFVNVGGRSFEISPDGTRALVILGSENTTRSIRMITGWIDTVKALVEGQK
jgi:serine/threonine-protein kinase